MALLDGKIAIVTGAASGIGRAGARPAYANGLLDAGDAHGVAAWRAILEAVEELQRVRPRGQASQGRRAADARGVP